MNSPVRAETPNPGKTLVFCPIGLGNFIMATPALAFLSRELGRENLDILALKGSIRAMAEASGYFGHVHFWDPDRQGLRHGIKILGDIRASAYRHSLSLFPTSHWKFGVFAALSGARERSGFRYPHQKWPERLQRLSVPLDRNAHDTDQNLRLAEAFLGKPCPPPHRLVFPLAPAPYPDPAVAGADPAVAGADSAGAGADAAGTGYFVCHPGSSAERGMEEKRLPPEAFAALIASIRREFGLTALLIGGPEESGLRKRILALAPEAAREAPSGSLETAAGQIAGSRFFLGNDSGLMHVAAALGKRCAAFFGPTDERRTGPYGWRDAVGASTRHLILRKAGLACAPCWTVDSIGINPPCVHGDTRCLRSFAPEEAWPALRAFLADVLAPSPPSS
jgi:ADP-heptose:LPS heptosyltransferase